MSYSPREQGVATIHDVARAAGVSRSTAARALAGYGIVSKEAAERVLAAAAELDYRANGVARSMKTGRSNTLGAVVADIENAFFARVMRGFTDVARANGFQVILSNTDEDPGAEQSAVRVFQERRVDGLVVTPASLDPTGHLYAAHAAGLPIVLLDRRVPGLDVDVVQIDNVKAARETIEHLIALGHRKIAMLTGVTEMEVSVHATNLDSGVSTSKDRLQGYREALDAAGIDYRPDYVRTADFHLMAAREEAERLLRLRDRPTAVFATDSTNALGVLLALRDVGLHVPQDVSVVAFDDADWADVVEPGLSVIAQPVHEMGRLSARLLVSRIRGEALPPTQHVLETQWLARESIGPPPHRRRAVLPA
jgi:LacI family transcriptional regulator, galactose operon repressor